MLMRLVFPLQTFLKSIHLLCQFLTGNCNSLHRFLCKIWNCVKRSWCIANIWLFQQFISSKLHHFQHISACCAAKSQCYKGFMYNIGICISAPHLQQLIFWCWWADQIFHIHEGLFEFVYLKWTRKGNMVILAPLTKRMWNKNPWREKSDLAKGESPVVTWAGLAHLGLVWILIHLPFHCHFSDGGFTLLIGLFFLSQFPEIQRHRDFRLPLHNYPLHFIITWLHPMMKYILHRHIWTNKLLMKSCHFWNYAFIA